MIQVGGTPQEDIEGDGIAGENCWLNQSRFHQMTPQTPKQTCKTLMIFYIGAVNELFDPERKVYERFTTSPQTEQTFDCGKGNFGMKELADRLRQ